MHYLLRPLDIYFQSPIQRCPLLKQKFQSSFKRLPPLNHKFQSSFQKTPDRTRNRTCFYQDTLFTAPPMKCLRSDFTILPIYPYTARQLRNISRGHISDTSHPAPPPGQSRRCNNSTPVSPVPNLNNSSDDSLPLAA